MISELSSDSGLWLWFEPLSCALMSPFTCRSPRVLAYSSHERPAMVDGLFWFGSAMTDTLLERSKQTSINTRAADCLR